jgi:leucyl-tRNA synthetase
VHDVVGKQGVQGYTRPEGKVDVLAEVTGMQLMGCKLHAPNSIYEAIYALPLMTIKENMGTGIVTCVPSDAPDDFAGLRDLKNKQQMREKYNITDEMVLPFDPVPIIDIPGYGARFPTEIFTRGCPLDPTHVRLKRTSKRTCVRPMAFLSKVHSSNQLPSWILPQHSRYGDMCAEIACDALKVASQNDKDKLAEAKDICYKKGFYEGIMKVGTHAGKKVGVAKDLVRAEMFEEGKAVLYREPEKYIESRSGDECVVALCDQWYLIYGETKWRAEVEEHLKNTLECFDPMTTKAFGAALDWLHEHACSRSFGLGTKMPFDDRYLIESLSVRCAFFGRNLHSRMPLVPTPLLRLKLLHACDQ